MPKVGRSSRTPFKHWLLNTGLGQLVGVAGGHGKTVPSSPYPFYYMADLCGGDGVETPQHRASPKIMLHHAAWGRTNRPGLKFDVQLDVIEKDENTFDVLKNQLSDCELPGLNLFCQDAREFKFPKFGDRQDVFIHCDPNSVTDMPLVESMVDQFNDFTIYLVTLGCNVSGIKRLPLKDRQSWFGYVDRLTAVLPNGHEAVLIWLNNDSSQWAYLYTTPKVWADEFCDRVMRVGGKLWPKGVSHACFKKDHAKFSRAIERLFLTKSEVSS